MVAFKSIIGKFEKNKDKTGWTYIIVPNDIAEQINPDTKKAFRVKGRLDNYTFEGISLLPFGEGNYLMALNETIRKNIRKIPGEEISVEMEMDLIERPFSPDFIDCLNDDENALKYFNTLTKSHQRYFSNWIESAKSIETKTKRIAQAVNALAMNLDYGEMIRMNKKENLR